MVGFKDSGVAAASEIVRLPIQAIKKMSNKAHQLAVPDDFKAIIHGWNPVSRNGSERAIAVASIETISKIRRLVRFCASTIPIPTV